MPASESTLSPVLLQEKLRLSGIRCAACVALIEFRVRQLCGVASFRINAVSGRGELSWDGDKTTLKHIIAAIIALGYGALPANQSDDEATRAENKMALWRLFVAGFAMMQIMMYAFPAYLVPVPQIDGDLTPDLDKLLKIASMLITVPVIGFSAMPFFQAAWRDLRNRHVGMDVPVSLGILLTFFASVWATFEGGAVYYDSAIMFVFLLLGARLIESKVQRKTSTALRVLTEFAPLTAQRLLHYPGRQTETVDASALAVEDILLVAAGEQIPADGVVLEGHSECDEALMTGESQAVLKTVGENVIAGAINVSGALVMRALRVGRDTELSSLIAMMEAAATEKPPIVLLADKHASRFLSLILIVAVLAALVWSTIDPSRALWIAISVIVVTCPCALSLATPGVMSAAIGLMANNGVLVKHGRAIQSMAQATHFVFDKTGTLTQGKLRLVHTEPQRTAAEQAGVLAFVLASASAHPVARAIADGLASHSQAAAAVMVESLLETAGGGVEARCDGRVYRLGSISFAMQLHGAPLSLPPAMQTQTVSVLADESGALLLFGLEDSLRDDAAQTIRQLQSRGKQICLLSGDRDDVVQRVATLCGISDARAGLSPGDKFAVVQDLQAHGAIVAMVGDGMNDGPVLSLAHVGIAMGQGAPISQTRSDLLLMSNRLTDLDYAFVVATKALRLIRENLIWAMLYNAVAIPAAVLGCLAPWHAALGMSLSSLIVVLNALRLYLLPQPQHVLRDNLVDP